METISTWFITATSPLGRETYNLRLNGDGSGSISHDRGTIEFSNAIVQSGGDSMCVEISGKTDIPMTVDYVCKFDSIGKSLNGFVQIGEYARVDIKGVKI